jgi:phage terminase large subunit-like protein
MESETRRDLIAGLTATQIEFLIHDWPLWARDKQLPPAGDWRVWLLMAGRGVGKTRTGAQWINNLALSSKGSHIGLVGDTMDDVRHVMVEGASGILACVPDWQKPDWQPSLRRLVWPNGIIARCQIIGRRSSGADHRSQVIGRRSSGAGYHVINFVVLPKIGRRRQAQ